jgi:CRISPR-associated endoribonuclease Cas6
LKGDYQLNYEKKIVTFEKDLMLTIDSFDSKFLNYFVNGSILNEKIRLGKNEVYINEIKVVNKRYKSGDKFYTKSPITVYSTLSNGEKKKTYFYSPYEKEFEEQIKNNLISKYKSFYGEDPKDSSFSIKLANKDKLKEKWTQYKGFIIKGWNGEFIITGSKEMIDIAYHCGIGGKNSQGFGMIDLCNNNVSNKKEGVPCD